jgi:hypothetical protein
VTELGAMRVDLVDFVVVRRSLSSWMRLRRVLQYHFRPDFRARRPNAGSQKPELLGIYGLADVWKAYP